MNKPNFTSLPFAARCTIILFVAAGLAAAIYTVAVQSAFAPGRLLMLLALAVVSARVKVNLFKGNSLSFLTSVVLLAVIQGGPAVAMLVGLCGVTVQTLFPAKGKVAAHQLAFNAGMIAVTVTFSWLTYHALAGVTQVSSISSEIVATVLASFAYFLGNSISVSVIVALTKGMSAVQIWFQHFMYSAPSFVIAGLLSVGVMAMISSSSFAIVAALVTAIAVAYYCSVRITAEA